MTMLRPFPVPSNDAARARTVDAMALMDRCDDPFFHHVTALVRQIFGTPIAFISLFSEDAQTFLAVDGLEMTGTPRDHSLCAFTVAAKSTIVLPDTHADPRSVNHPVVVNFGVRFSASAPVVTAQGFCLGTVCGIDLAPRDAPTVQQVAMLDTLALMVARYYEQPIEPDPAVAARLRSIARDAQREFLSLIGHEMKTPLNGIHGMAQVLEPKDNDDAEVIAAILSSSEHLNAVVDSILAFTELSSGEIALSEGQVSLDAALDRAVAKFLKVARMQGKSLAQDGGPSGIVLGCDGAKLELALACLVSNFVNHGGGRCTVSAGRLADGTVAIRVRDDGPGIEPAYQARIWQAFGLGQDVHRRRADGIGLGLPLTRRIVELHGGEVDLLRDDDGMTALIRLPAWRVAG